MTKRNNYPEVTVYPPTMKIKELRVDTSAGTDELTPTTGKAIRVLGFVASQFVTSDATTTLRSTLAFGDGHTTDTEKILMGNRQGVVSDHAEISINGINIIGEINEVVRLTNVTFNPGGIISQVVIYYVEE